MKLTAIAAPLLALSFTFVNPCSQRGKPPPPEPTAQDAVFAVRVVYPQFVTQPRKLAVSGQIEPSQRSVITARYNAIIDLVSVNEGDVVNKDDVLVTLSSDELDGKIAVKNARIKTLSARLKAAQAKINLYGRDDRPVSAEDVEFLDDDVDEQPTDAKEYGDSAMGKPADLKELVDVLEAEVDKETRAAEMLDRVSSELVHKSSLSGVVVKKTAVEGNRVKEKDPLLEIAQTDPVSVTFKLPKDVASFVDKQSTVSIVLKENTDVYGDGQVYFISSEIDTVTHTLEVRAYIANTQGLMKGGQDVEVRVATRKLERMMTLPRSAVVTEGDKSFVFVVYGQQVRLLEARLGDPGPNGTVEVMAEVRVDDPVVIEKPADLKNNSFVKVLDGIVEMPK